MPGVYWTLDETPLAAPTAGEIAEALSGNRGPVAVRLRMEHRTKAGLLLGDLSAAIVEVGSIECDNERDIVMTADVLFRADLLPETIDQVALVEERYIAGQWVQFPQGLYAVSFSEPSYLEDGKPLRPARLNDQAAHLVSATTQEPYAIASGTAYFAEMASIITGQGLRHALPSGGPVTPVAHRFPAGTPYYEILTWLAAGINYFPPHPGLDGVFVIRPRLEPATVPAVVTYTDTAEARMAGGEEPFREPEDTSRLQNRCVVVIDDPYHPDYGYTVWENNDPASPISTVNAPADLAERNSDSTPSTRAILDLATAESVARYELAELATLAQQAELATFPDPRRGPREYVAARLDGVVDATFRVRSWRRPMTAGGAMQWRLARAVDVTITEAVEGS